MNEQSLFILFLFFSIYIVYSSLLWALNIFTCYHTIAKILQNEVEHYFNSKYISGIRNQMTQMTNWVNG